MQTLARGGHWERRATRWLWRSMGLALLLSTLVLSCARLKSVVGGDDPPARVARLSSLAGTVSLEPSGSDSWSQATPNYTVASGDRLYTGDGSRAELDIGSAAA